MQGVIEKLGNVVDASARVLQGDHSPETQAALTQALNELEDARVKVGVGLGLWR
jgi:hypothetical protein